MTIAPQERILHSATRLFTELGYQHVSLRQIAEDADVNASLIIRHFTSKEALFLTIVDARARNSSEALAGSLDCLGVAIVTSILDSIDDPTSTSRSVSALLDATGSIDMRQEVSKITTKFFVQPVMDRITGEHKELRASLVVAQITGLVTQLYKLQNPILVASDREDIIQYYGRAIQSILDLK